MNNQKSSVAALVKEVDALEAATRNAGGNSERLTDLYLSNYQDVHQRVMSLVDAMLDEELNLATLLGLSDRLETVFKSNFVAIAKDLGADLNQVEEAIPQNQTVIRPLRLSGPKVVSDLVDLSEPSHQSKDILAPSSVAQERLRSSQLWLFDNAAAPASSSSSNDASTAATKSKPLSPAAAPSSRPSLTASQERALWVWDADWEREGADELITVEKDESDPLSPAPAPSSSSSSSISAPQKAEEQPHIPSHRHEANAGLYGDPDEEVTCPICTDEYKRSECFAFAKCKHTYCQDCLQAYFASKIKEKNVLDIKCPDPKCDTIVQYHEIGGVVDDELFQKYEDFSMLAALAQDPNCRWCPAKGCGNAMIADPAYPRIKCTKCSHEFCFKCGEDWHSGTCEDYKKWKIENGHADEAFGAWSDENTKPCPQCHAKIQKTEGCNHMTCGNCRYEFCWLCGSKYTSNHFDLYNVLGCPGMQSQSHENAGLAKRIGMRFLMGTGMVLGGALVVGLAVPALVIGGPIYGGIKLHKHLQKKKNRY